MSFPTVSGLILWNAKWRTLIASWIASIAISMLCTSCAPRIVKPLSEKITDPRKYDCECAGYSFPFFIGNTQLDTALHNLDYCEKERLIDHFTPDQFKALKDSFGVPSTCNCKVPIDLAQVKVAEKDAFGKLFFYLNDCFASGRIEE